VVGNVLECLRPDFHHVILGWADRYGGIVRAKFLWQDALVVTDPAALAAIMGRGEGAMDKASLVYAPINKMCDPHANANLLTSAADDTWKAVRKAVAVSFSMQVRTGCSQPQQHCLSSSSTGNRVSQQQLSSRPDKPCADRYLGTHTATFGTLMLAESSCGCEVAALHCFCCCILFCSLQYGANAHWCHCSIGLYACSRPGFACSRPAVRIWAVGPCPALPTHSADGPASLTSLLHHVLCCGSPAEHQEEVSFGAEPHQSAG